MKKLFLATICILFSFGIFAQIETVSVNVFERHLIATEGTQLIDIRTPQEFERNRISGARNINVRSPEFRKKIEQLDKTKPVLIYCMTGNRSRAAMEIFREAGFTIVFELNGGLRAWGNAGKTID